MRVMSKALGRPVSPTDLVDLEMDELKELYRELSGEHRSSFSLRADGIALVLGLFPREDDEPVFGTGRSKAPKNRRKRISSPPRPPFQPCKGGTKREQLKEVLEHGATVQECMDALGITYHSLNTHLRMLHTVNGYGIQEDDNGVLRLVTEA